MSLPRLLLNYSFPVLAVVTVLIMMSSLLVPAIVSSVVSSCSASVSPASFPTNVSDTLTFSLNNTSGQNIRWIRLTSHREKLEIENYL